jgi:Tol biopolymer transport system component
VRGLGESDKEDPLPEADFQVPRDWSPNGRFLAFTNTGVAQIGNESNGDVDLIDMAQGRKVIHLIDTPFHEDNPAFSPDGRWLAFTSNESGRSEVYLQAFEATGSPRLTGPRHLVSREGALALRWRRDGKELFFLAWDGRLHSVSIALSPNLKISTPAPLFTIGTEARAAIHSLPGFDVSIDGQKLLIPVVVSTERSEIVVIQNWELELQKNRNNVH